MRFLTTSLLAVCMAFAGTVTHTLEVAPGDVVLAQSDDYAVVKLNLERNGVIQAWTNEPGSPLLPVLSGNVLIPAGADVEKIVVVPLARVELGDFYVHPVQPMRPLSEFNSVPFVQPDQAVYGTDAVYPAEPLTAIPAGSKAGFRIAGFLYCPFEYRPASGRLTLITKARVEVRYQENTVAVPVLTESQRDLMARDVAELIVNPQDVDHMAPPAAEKDAGELDVVVFTNSTLAPSLDGLRKWLMRKGYFTEIVQYDTLSTTGRDDPEKMREFLKQKFADNGLKYVILAGDYDKCPLRYGYLPYSTYNVPAEMYFGDLDGDWDANGNSKFGEMTGDSVDLFHDIYVGRLPLDDAGDAANFLRKDTTYEIVPDTGYLDDVILPSEWLWQNIDFSGRIVNTNIARALSAASPWAVDSGLNIGSARVISGVNAGRHHFHFAGHGGNTSFGSTFSSSHISSLTNVAKPCIVMTMACNCGWFDASSDCLGELFVNATNGGAVSTMFNARYGWGAPPTQGPNSNMNCQFYHNFLKGMTQGKAHGLAKDFLRNESFSQLTMRWAMYTNTLQGDPTMTMWREVPVVPTVTHDDTIAAMPQTVAFEVENADGPIPGARCAITHLGELIGRATANSTGSGFVPLEMVDDTWTLMVTVTAQDAFIYEARLHVIPGGPAPLVLHDHSRVDDANGRLDPGDEVDIYFVVRNRGDADADSVFGRLAALSPYITLLDTFSFYGDVAVGDTASGEAYRVRVDSDCPHGHRVEFMLGLVSGHDGAWMCEPKLIVGLPNASGWHYATLDTGDYCLAVCANGGIGTTQWRGEGYGFIYPKNRRWSTTSMMHGSLVIGTDTNWVCDNYYGYPWKVCPLDFAMEESVRIVYPPELGDKEFICTFSDADHPEPKDVTIDHRAYGSARSAHQDFVILEYRVFNNGTTPLPSLYTAVACDFRTPDWNKNDQYDYAGTDSTRNLAYVKASPETLALGIRHIYPAGMNGYANCIQHSTHINDGFTKTEKMKFMDGRLRQTTGTTKTNWHAMSSSGPYTIPAGDSQIIAYVLVGGRTVDQMTVHSDTAANWYSPPVGVEDRGSPSVLVRSLQVLPRLFTERVKVRYSLSRVEPITLFAYDALGREMDRIVYTPGNLVGDFSWRPTIGPGVYFLKAGDTSEKVLKLK